MYRFNREKIFALFLSKQITTNELARLARISHKAAARALAGLPVTAPVVARVAKALNVDALLFLLPFNSERGD